MVHASNCIGFSHCSKCRAGMLKVLFISTGKDDFGKILAEKAREAGVNVNYMVNDKEPTGTCAVCITGKHRLVLDRSDILICL